MINDVTTDIATFKYVDDTMLYIISNDPKDTMLQKAVDTMLQSSSDNDMRINGTKTKEMFICFNKSPPSVAAITIDTTGKGRHSYSAWCKTVM